jgi:hypothetical protein
LPVSYTVLCSNPKMTRSQSGNPQIAVASIFIVAGAVTI